MNTTKQLAINLIKLRLDTRRACMCEDGDKKLLSLKTKILFLLKDGVKLTPVEIMNTLKIAKPNLTILGNALFCEGLIIRESLMDKRNIVYSMTPKGEEYLNTRINRVAESLNLNKLTEEMTVEEAERCIRVAAELLDGIV